MYLGTGEKFYLEYTWGRKAGGSRSRPCIHTRRGVSTQTWTRSDKKLNTASWWVYSGRWPLRCWGQLVWYTSHQLQTTQENHVRADTEHKKVLYMYHLMTLFITRCITSAIQIYTYLVHSSLFCLKNELNHIKLPFTNWPSIGVPFSPFYFMQLSLRI